jgi:hypothetical protein
MTVKFLTFILEVPGSNLGQNTKSSDVFHGSLQFFRENSRRVPQNHAMNVNITINSGKN